MLIKELCDYYDLLAEQDKIIPDGYSKVSIHYCICLSPKGEITNIISKKMDIELTGTKKTKSVPQEMLFPFRTQKSSIDGNIIEHRPLYIFGLNANDDSYSISDKTNKACKSHEEFVKTNLDFIKDLHSPLIDAYRLFIKNWIPQEQENNSILMNIIKTYSNGGYCFCLENDINTYLQNDPIIKNHWNEIYQKRKETLTQSLAQCPISGKYESVARLHNKIKGVNGGNSTGTALVSFNNASEESYGNKDSQGLNSNISEESMKKYTEALNYLLKESNHKSMIGNTTIVHWAYAKDEQNYLDWFNDSTYNSLNVVNKEEVDKGIQTIFKEILSGKKPDFQSLNLCESVPYYICGLYPNAARLSIKFFYKNTFGSMMKNILKYHEEMTCEYGKLAKPFYFIEKELCSPNSTNAKLPPDLTEKLVRSMLFGDKYPELLFETMVHRIKIDELGKSYNINDVRIGIIKACLIRNYHKEDIKMSLEIDNIQPAYLLGRLFAVLEKIQQDSAGNSLNKTIKDSYFASACTTPALVFPRLLMLAQNHIAKLDSPVYYNSLLGSIISKLPSKFPNTLSLEEQGEFIIGYYHENKNIYTKKENQIKEID